MKKILVFNVNWIGDVIFSSPIFKALKEKYPQAHISCVAVPRVKDVLECVPCVDRVITYDEKGKDWGLWAKGRFIKFLRREKFDCVFILHQSWTRALLVYLAGIPVRVGYPTKQRGLFLTHQTQSSGHHLHRSDHYLNVIESFGVKVNDRQNQLNVSKDLQSAMDELLIASDVKKSDYIVVVHVGANWDLKRWPLKNYSRLIDQLLNFSNVKVVIPGTSSDFGLVNEITASCKGDPINLAGKTSLKQLIGLMKRANLVISADSGPLHVASSLGTKTIGIFGPTRPELTGPRGKENTVILQKDVGCNREACYFLECSDNVCMQAVTVKDVINAVQEFKN